MRARQQSSETGSSTRWPMKPPARIATIRQSPRTSTKHVSLVNPNAGMIGMAFPGTFIVDRYGRVTSRFFEEFYRDRHTASSLMMALGGRAGAVAGAQISTDHLEIRTYATDTCSGVWESI